MANNIKGITVEIGGDTGPLSTALKDVNKTAGNLQSELKEINRQLKFDPNNTILLQQKQELLAKQIANTKEKLTTLKEAEKQVEQQFQSGKLGEEKYRAFQREVEKTESQLKSLKEQARQSSSILGAQFSNAGEKVSEAGVKIGQTGQKLLPVTLAIGGIAAAAMSAGNAFEAQMSRVSAIAGATGDDLESLKNQALQLGQDTAYSASEAARGMENLASAGLSTKEIMEAMPGMLNLAASSGEDLANSADIAASMLRGFNLSADQAGHVADVLAKNAANTNAAVADTGAAMKYIAPVAQNAGWSLESVTAAIGAMADAGIKGEQAGTTLRGALTSLMNPSKEQANAMNTLGFSAYDAQGRMKPLSQIIDELNQKTAGLTNEQRDGAIATIMGTSALSGMQILLKTGSENLDKLTASLQSSDGAAKQMAETMLGNTKGAIEQMKGAIETAAIKIQELLAPLITKIAQYITGLINKFSALSPATQKIILLVAGVIGAVAPLLILIGKITQGIGGLMQGIGFLMANPVVAIVLAVIAAIALLAVGIKRLWDTNEGFRTAVTNIWNGIKNVISGVVNAVVGFFTVTIPQAWNRLVAFMKQWGPLILTIIAPILGVPLLIMQHWEQIQAFFVQLWNNIISFFTTTIPAWIASVIEWFNQLPVQIGQAIGRILASIVNFGYSAIQWVAGTLSQIITSIINWFAQLPVQIGTFLTNIVNNIVQWGANMVAQAIIVVPRFINKVLGFIGELPGKIWGFLSQVIANVVQWCSDLIATAQTEIPKFVSTVVGFIGELPGKMLEIGGNIVRGIWDGINGAIDWLHDRIADFCRSIVDSFKDHLDIHSPSRLFADIIGKNIALGIGQGFANSIDAVIQSMASSIPSTLDTSVQVRAAMTAAYGGSAAVSSAQKSTQGTSGESVQPLTFKQYNQYYSPKALSPAEAARQTRNATRQIILAAKGV